MPIRVLQELLGHGSATVTQNLYAHVLEEMKDEAADVMDRLFGDL